MYAFHNLLIKELGFSAKVSKGDYIPESLFYLLGMKANNEKKHSKPRSMVQNVDDEEKLLSTLLITGQKNLISPQVSKGTIKY